MTDPVDLRLRFTVNTLCLAEASLRKPLAAIFEEVQSEDGAEMRTLRALVAAGRVHLEPMARAAEVPGYSFPLAPYYDENRAGQLIEKHGIAVVAEQVGRALAAFVARISGAA